MEVQQFVRRNQTNRILKDGMLDYLMFTTEWVNAVAAWPAANQAIFFKFKVPVPRRILKFFWYNGGTIGGNVDFGIVQVSGGTATRIGANMGATAQAAINSTQIVTLPTPIDIPGGSVLLAAVSCDSATAVFGRTGGTTAIGGLAETRSSTARATTHPIPASFSEPTTGNSYGLWCGVIFE